MAETTKNEVVVNKEQEVKNEAPQQQETTEVGFWQNPFVAGVVKVVKIFAVVAAAATGLVVAEKIGESIGEKKSKSKDELDEVMDIVNSDDTETESN